MIDLSVERVDVWAGSIEEASGGLALVLKALRDVGADLDFIIARRAAESPGKGVVFLTPLRGEKEVAAAINLGFKITNSVHSVRVEGENKPGIAAAVSEKLAAAGINLRGFSAGVIGSRFIFYIGFDSRADAAKAAVVLKQE